MLVLRRSFVDRDARPEEDGVSFGRKAQLAPTIAQLLNDFG